MSRKAVEDAVGNTTGEILDDLRELQREGMGEGLDIPLPDSSMAPEMKDAVGDAVAEGSSNTIKSGANSGRTFKARYDIPTNVKGIQNQAWN